MFLSRVQCCDFPRFLFSFLLCDCWGFCPSSFSLCSLSFLIFVLRKYLFMQTFLHLDSELRKTWPDSFEKILPFCRWLAFLAFCLFYYTRFWCALRSICSLFSRRGSEWVNYLPHITAKWWMMGVTKDFVLQGFGPAPFKKKECIGLSSVKMHSFIMSTNLSVGESVFEKNADHKTCWLGSQRSTYAENEVGHHNTSKARR